jgi:hypothetical protein
MTVQTKDRPRRSLLFLARLLYLVLFAAGIYLIIASLPDQFDPEAYICTHEPCQYETVAPSELQPLEQSGLTPELYILYRFWLGFPLILTLFLGVSLLIFLLRSDEWIGLLTAIFLLTFPVALLAGDVIEQMAAWTVPFGLFSAIGAASIVVLFYVFPDGKFVPGWTRWLALAALAWSIITRLLQLLFPSWLSQARENLTVNLLYFLLLALAFLSQIYRYRRVSGAIQRQQTKWVITAAIMMPLSDLVIRGILTWLLPFANQPGPERVIFYMITIPILRTIPFMLVPISFAFAILRYRLWDIDIIIRRSLVYGGLTASLAVVYFSSVVLIQSLLTAVGGRQVGLSAAEVSPIVTVISTLLIAVLFSPLRRRIQSGLDRRFYRKKYDAEKIVAAFGSSLRQEVDMDDLQYQIVAVVQETLQPQSVSLWVRDL